MDNFKTYFAEAYQKMTLLEKDFDISKDVLDGAKAWQEDDSVDGLAGLDTDIETIDVIDPEAEQEDELEDSYVGKVILECVACHSKMVVDESKVYEDEETQTASPDIPCPVCNAELGYTILGKVEPFEKEEAEEEPLEFPAEDEEEEVEEEEVVEESLHDRIRRKHLGESKVCPKCGKDPCECEKMEEGKACEDCDKMDEALTINTEPYDEVNLAVKDEVASEDAKKLEAPEEEPILNEAIENLSLDTEDQHLEMTSDDSGKVTITTEPLNEESLLDEPDMEIEGEMVAPLENTDIKEIEANVSPEEQVDAFTAVAEEEPVAAEEEDSDFELENESFNYLGNTFAKKLYENVQSFETTKSYHEGDNFIIEGLLTFNSGKQRPTKFTFDEATETRTGRVVLEGYNKTFTADRAFKLRGKLTEGKFISESMRYNYSIERLNESTGVSEPIPCRGVIRGK